MDISRTSFEGPVFYVARLPQKGYDRELDEGMSSGLIRCATLDVSKLSESQIDDFLGRLINEVKDFRLCKHVQLLGFNKEGKRYVAVSGETHAMYQGSTIESVKDKIGRTYNGLEMYYVKEHVTPTVPGENYQSTNLGRYGSTGSPMNGVTQHPDAQKLRDENKIR